MSDIAYQECPVITCVSREETARRLANMANAFGLGLKRLPLDRPAHTKTLAVVGGGPTLNDTYKNINDFDVIMSCGSSHDHLTKLGIKSDYHLECDPDLAQVKYYQSVKLDCTYLLASRCHASMFSRLKGRRKLLWHFFEDDLPLEAYRGEQAVRTAISCTLSAMSVSASMGYRDVHFFGFDSSFPSGTQHHAYDCEESAEMTSLRMGDPETGRQFLTTTTWIAQARTFYKFQEGLWDCGFRATVHGDSLMREMQKQAGLGYV